MKQQIDALQGMVARLQKNSSNSSKPPSSDIVKPPKSPPTRGKKRGQGGQPDDTKYERTLDLEETDVRHAYHLDRCATCADQALVAVADGQQIHCQYELVENPIALHAHQAHAYWCATCDTMQTAPLPSALHREGLGARLSTRMLAKAVDNVSQALAPIYQPLVDALPDQARNNIDETGHKDRGRLLWTWVWGTPCAFV